MTKECQRSWKRRARQHLGECQHGKWWSTANLIHLWELGIEISYILIFFFKYTRNKSTYIGNCTANQSIQRLIHYHWTGGRCSDRTWFHLHNFLPLYLVEKKNTTLKWLLHESNTVMKTSQFPHLTDKHTQKGWPTSSKLLSSILMSSFLSCCLEESEVPLDPFFITWALNGSPATDQDEKCTSAAHSS